MHMDPQIVISVLLMVGAGSSAVAVVPAICK